MEKLREKVKNLEENLSKWESQEPELEIGIKLKEKVLEGLKNDIEQLNILINNFDIKQN